MTQSSEAVAGGWLAQRGALSAEQCKRAGEIIDSATANGLETVRVVFVDQHGLLRGKTITTDGLASVFATGLRVPSTLLLKDTSHRTVFPVWHAEGDSPMHNASDVVLAPQPETFWQTPWSAHSAVVHCDVLSTDGEPVLFSSRAVLQRQVDLLADRDLLSLFGLEVEFQIYKRVSNDLGNTATATHALNSGMQYLTESRYGEVEPLLDEIRRAAQSSGMPVQSVEIEMGPSQFEFTFAPADPLSIAGMAVNFRALAKAVCHRHGYVASFMAKPRLPNAMGNGWHIHQSLLARSDQRNRFMPDVDGTLTDLADQWVAGLLANAESACLMTTPTVNGYKRFSEYQLAPNRVGWGLDNRGAMVRAIVAAGDATSRVENRVADSAANPYFAIAVQIASGLDGVARKLESPPPLQNPYDDVARLLPSNLHTAIELFERSVTMQAAFGEPFVAYLTTLKRAEWERYLNAVSEWEQDEYFDVF